MLSPVAAEATISCDGIASVLAINELARDRSPSEGPPVRVVTRNAPSMTITAAAARIGVSKPLSVVSL